jgi:hypothetical protein
MLGLNLIEKPSAIREAVLANPLASIRHLGIVVYKLQ